jgi:hypothetical protein
LTIATIKFRIDCRHAAHGTIVTTSAKRTAKTEIARTVAPERLTAPQFPATLDSEIAVLLVLTFVQVIW